MVLITLFLRTFSLRHISKSQWFQGWEKKSSCDIKWGWRRQGHQGSHHEHDRHCSVRDNPYPGRHLVSVGVPVMIVEDEDGRHHRGGHHEHDAVEVGTCENRQRD